MPAGPPLPVIVNTAGGAAGRAGDSLSDHIQSAFKAAGQSVALELVDGDRLRETIELHSTARRVVVGGGDGTLNTAAAIVAEAGSELAILPLGTLNHFARQLQVPPDLEAAAALAVTGAARNVDIAEAGGRVFINNLSAGAYVDLVRRREALHWPKVLATIPAAWRTLRKLRSRSFELTLDGESRSIRTPLLFIGNNRYEVEKGHPSERATLDDGKLSIYAAAPLSRTALVAAAMRTLAGHPRMHRDFVLDETAQEVRIDGPSAALEVALDGEPCRFDLPLTIRIRPRALAVVAPESN
jgi:diacylglycerol kinase family enzyme